MVATKEPSRLLAGRYRLIEALGSGGMGTVWLARDQLLHRQVAVKEVTPPADMSAAEREQLRERTLREARTAARLTHPNVVTIYDVIEDGGRPWIVMELVPSRSLRDIVLSDGPLTPQQAAHVGLQLLAALRAAHERGIMHRDVKPGNVLIDHDGRAVLADFGIARTADSSTLTTTGMLVGSPSYIAPERARGERGGPGSDLWSLGATLYAAVEGRPPHDRGGALATLTAIVTEDPDPPQRGGPLGSVISGLLCRDPDRRLRPAEAERMLRQVAGTDDLFRTSLLPGPADTGEAGPAGAPVSPEDRLGRAERTRAFPPARVTPVTVPQSTADPVAVPRFPAEPAAGAHSPAEPAAGAHSPAEPAAGAHSPAEPAPEPPSPAAEPPAPEPPSPAAPAPEPPSPAAEPPAARTGAGEDDTATPPAGLPVLAPQPPAPDPEPLPAPAPPRQPEPGTAGPGAVPEPVPHQSESPDVPGSPAGPRDKPASRRPARTWAAAAAAALVLVAALLLGLKLSGTGSPARHDATGTGRPAHSAPVPAGTSPAGNSPAGTSPAGSPAATPSSSPKSSAPSASSPGAGTQPAIPAGFRPYHDPTGFSIAVPDGWQVSHQGHYVYLIPPSGAMFLLIDQTTHPNLDPLADWQQQEASRIGTYPDYHRIRLTAIYYPQAEKAADWEFTYDRNGVPTHVLNRNVLANARHAYALYWSTPSSQWAQEFPLFQVLARTFQPAGA